MIPIITEAPSTSSPPFVARPPVGKVAAYTPRRGLVVGLLASVAVHLAFSLWPAEVPETPESLPLQATLTELPPPPKPAAAAPTPRPKPRRATAPRAAVAEPVTAPEPMATPEPEPQPTPPTADAIAMGPEPAIETVAADPSTSLPELPAKTLPRRVDLVYKASLGTQGFVVGEAVYRFEHSGNEYQITTVGEAKGLAALFLRGQGRVESRGFITATGLQPHEFVVERGSKDKRETAVFDWETGMVTLFEQKAEALELSTFDPLTLMWQAYFSPPVADVQDISIATTRRILHYTLTREAEEKIKWSQGDIMTERWHRKSDDGKTDATFWLAPSLRYVPVKMRVTATRLGVIEALLDSIRVDEAIAQQ